MFGRGVWGERTETSRGAGREDVYLQSLSTSCAYGLNRGSPLQTAELAKIAARNLSWDLSDCTERPLQSSDGHTTAVDLREVHFFEMNR